MRKFIQAALLWAFFVSVALAQTTHVTGTITTQNLVPTGAATPGSCVELDVQNKGAATVQIPSAGTGALSLQRTVDGSTWETLTASTTFTDKGGSTSATISSGGTGVWQLAGITGAYHARLCALAAVTGSYSVVTQSSTASLGGGSSGGGGGGASTLASGAVASGAYSSGSIASGAFASGAISSGAVASGAYASGSIASGAMVDLGAQADSSCGTDTGTCTLIALIKRLNSLLDGTSSQFAASLGATNSSGSPSFTLSTQDMGPNTAATATATRGVVVICNYLTTPPAATNGQQVGIQCAPNGSMLVSPSAPTTGTQTSVASSATDVTILASNASRKGACVYNDSTQTLYLLAASGTSSTTNYTSQVPSQTLFCVRVGEYSGVLKGIWSSANGNARVTEWQ